MDSRIEIKEEDPLSDDIGSQNQTEFFHEVVIMKRESDVPLGNDCDVAVKTEIKSETAIPKYFVKQIKSETATCSNNWETDRKTENEEQTLVSDFGSQNEDPVMKDEKYDSEHEMDNKIEPWWLKTETSSICDDIKDGELTPVRSSRLYMEEVSGASSGKSPLPPVQVSGRDTRFCSGKDHLECAPQKSDVIEMLTTEEHVLSEQSGKYTDGGEMHMAHKGQRSYKCNVCPKIFSWLSHLKRHHLIHEDNKPYQCKSCDKSFAHLSALKRHNLIHEGKKPHQCKTCGKSFTRLSHLKTHNLIHEGKKPHQCKTCDKTFTELSTLKRHNLIHDGKRPYQCKTCDKSFTRVSHLKTHNLIHEGKKPHQCKTCDKCFTELSTLKTHNLIHEGKKPHQCKSCSKRFTRLSHLKTHNLIHERKKATLM